MGCNVVSIDNSPVLLLIESGIIYIGKLNGVHQGLLFEIDPFRKDFIHHVGRVGNPARFKLV